MKHFGQIQSCVHAAEVSAGGLKALLYRSCQSFRPSLCEVNVPALQILSGVFLLKTGGASWCACISPK